MKIRFVKSIILAACVVFVGCGGAGEADEILLPGALPDDEAGETPAIEGTETAVGESTGGGEETGGEGGETAGEGGETAVEGGETAGEGGETSGEGGETAGEGGETAGEGGETSGEGGETAGEGGETTGEGGGPTKEDCVNGTDDDADGLVDCQDPECASKPTCSEADCGNGADDDGNGLVDCEDPQCEFTDACMVESCSTFYLCLAEKGCDCEIGVDCTFTVGDDSYGQCQTTCYQNQTCNDQCVSELSLGVQENLSAYNNCTTTFCANSTTDAEYSECIFENCVEEYVTCFYTGDDNCSDFYGCLQAQNCSADTMTDEQYSECVSPCYDNVSASGFKDAIAWDNCRFDLCNLDGDNQADSTLCLLMASYLACHDSSGTCLDNSLFLGEGTCSDVANCLAECEDFTTPLPDQPAEAGDVTCDLVCLEQMNPATSVELSALFTCALTTCGSTEDTLTPACLGDAFAGDCATEFGACQ
jgi:hypothetical protein